MQNSDNAKLSITYTIKKMKRENVREVGNILAATDPWRTLGYQPEALSHYLLRADPALGRHCLFVSGNLAGVLTVRSPWLLGPFIELIAVFDAYRGKGFGKILIDWVCAQSTKSPNLWVTVSSFNIDARRFYARLGFEEAATLKDLIRRGFDEILLRKRL